MLQSYLYCPHDCCGKPRWRAVRSLLRSLRDCCPVSRPVHCSCFAARLLHGLLIRTSLTTLPPIRLSGGHHLWRLALPGWLLDTSQNHSQRRLGSADNFQSPSLAPPARAAGHFAKNASAAPRTAGQFPKYSRTPAAQASRSIVSLRPRHFHAASVRPMVFFREGFAYIPGGDAILSTVAWPPYLGNLGICTWTCCLSHWYETHRL